MKIVVIVSAAIGILTTLVTGLVAVAAFYLVSMDTSFNTAEALVETLADHDFDRLQKAVHPSVLAKMDKPVVETWMNSLTQSLGNYQKMSNADFSTSWEYHSNGRIDRFQGVAIFDNGTVIVSTTELDHQITQFDIDAPTMTSQWFASGPSDNQLYIDQAIHFAKTFGNQGGDEANQLMSAALQKVISIEQLNAAHENFVKRLGEFQNIEAASCDFDPSTNILRVNLQIKAEKSTASGYVNFQLSGFKMELVGFNIHEDSQSQPESQEK